MATPHSRTRSLSLLITLLATATVGYAQAPKEMAITFDDLPFAYPGKLTIAEQRDAVMRVLATLDKHHVKATMFVTGATVTDMNRDMVDAVVRKGHVVGNHTFSHPNLAIMSVEDYTRDIQNGEVVIRSWLKGVEYFRYPYLRQGNTVEKREAVLSWLASRGIVVAPVTIDNNDYEYNHQVVDAKAEGRTTDVRDAYLDHMIKMARFYDAKGRTKMGRPIKQVLLLHMSYLNSLYLDDLLQRFRDEGWSFITFDEALTDDVYRLKYEYVGKQGAGHLDAIKLNR
jgi:peptidoglycan-N-acetylglucosamine deacetylase